MKITVITLFPKMIQSFTDESIIKRAIEKKLVEIEIINLRDYAIDAYGSVDDRPYGGGAGMILRIDILKKAIQFAKNPKSQIPSSKQIQNSKFKILNSWTVLTSAKGKKYNQDIANKYSQLNNLIIIAGHYEGVDERVLDYIDEEISLGDFVMTGGEITAAAIIDSVVRLLPGVLKKEDAIQKESFFEIPINRLIGIIGEYELLRKLREKGVEKVKLLEYPQYTRPEIFEGKKVPEVLLSGNHKEIEKWQLKEAFEITLKKRPDLLK